MTICYSEAFEDVMCKLLGEAGRGLHALLIVLHLRGKIESEVAHVTNAVLGNKWGIGLHRDGDGL